MFSYPTCICFLKNIFFKRHIMFNNILHKTSYVCFQTTYTCYVISSDTCMSCILEQHIYDPYVKYSCILPHPSRLSWRSQQTNLYFNWYANLLFPQNISIVLSRLRSSSEMMFSTSCVHVPQWCRSCAILRGNSDAKGNTYV